MNDKRASVDIGSNSILLLAGEFTDGHFKELLNESHVTGLGRDLDKNQTFLSIAMEESLDVLKKYSQLVKKHEIDPADVIVTATEAARIAKNASEFFHKVKIQTGFDVKIITGAGEAYFSTKGILFNTKFQDQEIVIMDIGGASTEIIQANPKTGKINLDFSMPFGAVRVTNWLAEKNKNEKLDLIRETFQDRLNKIKTNKLFCVAGTMTSVANMYLGHAEFQEKKIHGLEFSTSEISLLLEDHAQWNPEQFLEKFPFLGKRSKTIIGGMIVATTIFNWLNIDRVEISTYGLRYGTLEQGCIPNEYLA